MSTTASELEQLIPQATKVSVAGDTVILYPLKVGLLPAMLRAVGGLAGHLQRDPIDWLQLLAEHGDALLDAVAIGSGKTRAWVDGLAPDDALLLAAKVVEVNADFFARRVIPRIETLFDSARTLAAASGTAGSTPPSA
jgi:hypothetical protein